MNRYRLVHRTVYEYDDEVTTSYGRAHLVPRDLEDQRCLRTTLAVDPEAHEQREHVDYFGNRSTYFVVTQPHETLTVTATSTVLVDRLEPSAEALDQPWELARDAVGRFDAAVDFLLPSPLVEPAAVLTQYAEQVLRPGAPLGVALVELLARIHGDFAYKAGATTVRTTLPEVLARRSGVCQDFAHLAVGCLRAMGLAARYVSGYVETTPPPGKAKLVGADASHAWASVFVPGAGWVDLDPTNDQFVDNRYVVAGWGRDYSDVPPLKGVIMTDATKSTMQVSVDLSRTD